jgi:hypothetical protein
MASEKSRKPTDDAPLSEPDVSIGAEAALYGMHIDSLAETSVPLVGVLKEIGNKHGQNLNQFHKAKCILENAATGLVRIPQEHVAEWKKLKRNADSYRHAQTLVPRSLLVTLVSQYDAFIGRLLRAIFLLKPETLNASEKQLSFSQLMTFRTLGEAREFLVEKEVEGVLRSSHADQFKWMENRFSVPLTKGLSIWPLFVEVTERRNLFVHADGVVSRQYLSTCRDHGCSLDPGVEEGSKLEVSPEYFAAACDCLYELGFKLAHVLWRRLLPDDREEADRGFIQATYDLIVSERYKLACSLLDFACEYFKKFANEQRELMMIVNRAQAHRWRGEKKLARQIMDAVDWSAKGDEFKLANAVLSENWQHCYDLMKRIGSANAMQKVAYREWPLFRELRAAPGFAATFSEVFGELFAKDMPIKDGELEDGKGV